jgi:ESF2/ABP1 family protein
MSTRADVHLDRGSSDESDNDQGYDSEAAEISRTARASTIEQARKRRKFSHSSYSADEVESDGQAAWPLNENGDSAGEDGSEDDEKTVEEPVEHDAPSQQTPGPPSSKAKPTVKRKLKHKEAPRPGVIYFSSLPPYLRPSALRNILIQRGFDPITRLFLAPTSTTRSKSKSSRQMYSEGWIEFASHKTAKKCVDALNAHPVGGKKGGYYRDDVWNMRYLRGMGWRELMEGIQGERREEEARRDEERRRAEREAKMFIEGVEEGKMVEGMREKRRKKKGAENDDAGGGAEPKRTWRQFEVKGQKRKKENDNEGLSQEAQEVLGKIF